MRGAVLGTGVVLALHAIAPNARGKEHISEEARTYFRNGVELLSAEIGGGLWYGLKAKAEESDALSPCDEGRTSSTRPSTGFERHDTTELVLQPLAAPGFGAFLLSGDFE